jgi:hypothetical protein
MQCEIFRAIAVPGSKGLQIAECGMGFMNLFDADVKWRLKTASIRNPQSAIRNPQSAIRNHHCGPLLASE